LISKGIDEASSCLLSDGDELKNRGFYDDHWELVYDYSRFGDKIKGKESELDIFLPPEKVKLKIYKCDDGRYVTVEQVDGRTRYGGMDCYVSSTSWREVAEIEVEL